MKRLLYLATRRKGAISVSIEGGSHILRRKSGSNVLMLERSMGGVGGREGIKGIGGGIEF